MGRIVGFVAAASIAATIVVMSARAGSRSPGPPLASRRDDADHRQRRGESGRPAAAPYYPPGQKCVNSGMPGPPPPDVLYTPVPTAHADPTPTPLPQVKIDGVRTDRVPTPGQLLFDKTRDIAFMDPLNWSVTIFKKRHQLIVYYKGRLFKDYHAVFGRSFEPGTKPWEGDRRTPEGVYKSSRSIRAAAGIGS